MKEIVSASEKRKRKAREMAKWLNEHRIEWKRKWGKTYFTKAEVAPFGNIHITRWVRYRGVFDRIFGLPGFEEQATYGHLRLHEPSLAIVDVREKTIYVDKKSIYPLMKEFGEKFKFKKLVKNWPGA